MSKQTSLNQSSNFIYSNPSKTPKQLAASTHQKIESITQLSIQEQNRIENRTPSPYMRLKTPRISLSNGEDPPIVRFQNSPSKNLQNSFIKPISQQPSVLNYSPHMNFSNVEKISPLSSKENQAEKQKNLASLGQNQMTLTFQPSKQNTSNFKNDQISTLQSKIHEQQQQDNLQESKIQQRSSSLPFDQLPKYQGPSQMKVPHISNQNNLQNNNDLNLSLGVRLLQNEQLQIPQAPKRVQQEILNTLTPSNIQNRQNSEPDIKPKGIQIQSPPHPQISLPVPQIHTFTQQRVETSYPTTPITVRQMIPIQIQSNLSPLQFQPNFKPGYYESHQAQQNKTMSLSPSKTFSKPNTFNIITEGNRNKNNVFFNKQDIESHFFDPQRQQAQQQQQQQLQQQQHQLLQQQQSPQLQQQQQQQIQQQQQHQKQQQQQQSQQQQKQQQQQQQQYNNQQQLQHQQQQEQQQTHSIQQFEKEKSINNFQKDKSFIFPNGQHQHRQSLPQTLNYKLNSETIGRVETDMSELRSTRQELNQMKKERDWVISKMKQLQFEVNEQTESHIKTQSSLINLTNSFRLQQQEKNQLIEQIELEKNERIIEQLQMKKLLQVNEYLKSVIQGEESLESIIGQEYNQIQTVQQILEERDQFISDFKGRIQQFNNNNNNNSDCLLKKNRKKTISEQQQREEQDNPYIQIVFLESEKQELELKVFIVNSLRKQEISQLKNIINSQNQIIQQNEMQIKMLNDKTNHLENSLENAQDFHSQQNNNKNNNYSFYPQINIKEGYLTELEEVKEVEEKNYNEKDSNHDKPSEGEYNNHYYHHPPSHHQQSFQQDQSANNAEKSDKQQEKNDGQTSMKKNQISFVSYKEYNENSRLNKIKNQNNNTNQISNAWNFKDDSNNDKSYLNQVSQEELQRSFMKQGIIAEEGNQSSEKSLKNKEQSFGSQNGDVVMYTQYLQDEKLFSSSNQEKQSQQKQMQQEQPQSQQQESIINNSTSAQKKKSTHKNYQNYIETLKNNLRTSQEQRKNLEEEVRYIIQSSKEIIQSQKQPENQDIAQTASWGNRNQEYDAESMPELEEITDPQYYSDYQEDKDFML